MNEVKTCFGDLADYEGEFVISFGGPCPDAVPPQNCLVLSDPGDEALAMAMAVEPRTLVKGLIFHFPTGYETLDIGQIRRIQLQMLHRYYKDVFFPKSSLSTPDPHGVRKADNQQEVPEIVRLISGLKNAPYILRYPVADKLAILKMGLPVLLLLPGPSLKTLEPMLPELAKRCLTVCVSRSLKWCLDQGVEPDFVVQLDTYLVQQHFYQDLPPLPNTILVPLSIVPVHRYAHLFRGLFFMDSFNLNVAPNQFRLRENHVSTLMACLGLAECLHAPDCYLAGADLSSPEDGNLYCEGEGCRTASVSKTTQPVRLTEDRAQLDDSYGRTVYAPIRFLATATEADHFAETIAQTAGTRFHNLSRLGLLSQECFPPATEEDLLALAPLDRGKALRKLDKGLNLPEEMRLARYFVDLEKYARTIRENLHYLESCHLSGDLDAMREHPFAQFTLRLRDYTPTNVDTRDRLAITITGRWLTAARDARAWVALKLLRQLGKPIPVICMPGEEQQLTELFAPLFPEKNFRFVHLRHTGGPSNGHDAPDAIDEQRAMGELAELDAALLSGKARNAFHYFFDVYVEHNLLYFEPLFIDTERS